MNKSTIINGKELDLTGVTIDIDKISSEEFIVNVDCFNKSNMEQMNIISTLKGIFGSSVYKKYL